MSNCNNNINKELYSRKAILEVILNKYGKKEINFLELLGDGTGAEFYSTWLNINLLDLIEYDKNKYELYNQNRIYTMSRKLNINLNSFFKSKDLYFSKYFYDVINLDFCTYFYDNGKENCTASIVNNMFKYEVIKDEGLVFFNFMVKGLGANMSKQAVKDRDDIFESIRNIAIENGYDIEENLAMFYKSSISTQMFTLGVKVNKI